jgi:hypothetical protein
MNWQDLRWYDPILILLGPFAVPALILVAMARADQRKANERERKLNRGCEHDAEELPERCRCQRVRRSKEV